MNTLTASVIAVASYILIDDIPAILSYIFVERFNKTGKRSRGTKLRGTYVCFVFLRISEFCLSSKVLVYGTLANFNKKKS